MFNEKGFTLTEIAIVLAVASILAVAFASNHFATKPTKNMSADGRELLTLIQRAKVEAIRQGVCVGVVLVPDTPGNRGQMVLFVDDGAGAAGTANACDAVLDNAAPGGDGDGAEIVLQQQVVREEVTLTQSPTVATAADPNDTDLFDSISFDARSLVAATTWNAAARAIVFCNDLNPALATWWGRVVVSPSGSTEYQTNNIPANEANWSR